MAKFSIYLDMRNSKDGKGNIAIILRVQNSSTSISLGLERIEQRQWNSKASRVVNHLNETKMNRLIKSRERIMEDILDEIPLTGSMTIQSIKDRFLKMTGQDKKKSRKKPVNKKMLFMQRLKDFAESRESSRTTQIYMATYKMLLYFDHDIEKMTIDKIDKQWIIEFNEYLTEVRQNSKNAAAIHHRNIRAVLNDAVDEMIIPNNPYRRYEIKTDETRKRALTLEQVRLLSTYKVQHYQEKYRDMFMLMIYMIGINPVDLFNAKHSDVKGNRLEYKRAKTGTLYSVSIPDCAWDIINRYKGNKYLVDVSEEWKNYMDFTRRMNEALKKIGECERKGLGGKKNIKPLFPELTCYWARFTWASVASKIGHNKEVIGHALGHKWANTVTDLYIDFDMDKVDKAQIDVINAIID